ncbi:MAG: MurR/RpiR family transcriptional regulator [Clostridiales bacterium]|nr:MurR/RpiR family transcriptional regulator [Clostridiales bacterium]OPZ70071.1 MAG: putative HTH-type transcriptional regulator YbbH [Firmicutes bacterium ADurb.Bin467]
MAEKVISGRDLEYPTLALIRQGYEDMPRGQQKIADYVLQSPSGVVKCSISELAQQTGSKSESSIVRFYRSLGFKAYKDFKLKMAQEIASKTFYNSYEDIEAQDSPYDIKRKIFNGAILTLNANSALKNDGDYARAVQMIMQAKRIVLLGYAASAAICYYAHFRLLELGMDCHFSSDAHINTAILTQPNPGDLFFCVSMSGETRDIVVPLKQARERGAAIISLTGSLKSTLAGYSDVAILTRTDETTLIADAMNARISQMCTVDALFSMISIARGPEAFARLRRTRETFSALKSRG